MEAENWFCPACDTLLDDSEMGLEDVEIRPISGNNVDALKKGVELSLDKVPLDSLFAGLKVAACSSKSCWRAKATTTMICTGADMLKINDFFFLFSFSPRKFDIFDSRAHIF